MHTDTACMRTWVPTGNLFHRFAAVEGLEGVTPTLLIPLKNLASFLAVLS